MKSNQPVSNSEVIMDNNVEAPTTKHKVSIQSLFVIQSVSTLLFIVFAAYISNLSSDPIIFYSVLSIISLLAVSFNLWLSKRIKLPIKQTTNILDQLMNGQFTHSFGDNRGDEFGEILARLKSVQTQFAIKSDQADLASANFSRFEFALNYVDNNIMIADDHSNIIYVNNSLRKLLASSEQAIKKLSPQFAMNSLIGSSIDIFHIENQLQSAALNNQHNTKVVNLEFGELKLRLQITPIDDTNNGRMETMIEWQDRSTEIIVENEIDKMIDAVQAGHLNQTIEFDAAEGVIAQFRDGINHLLSVCNTVIKETGCVMSAISQGDLSQKINSDYKGSFAQLQDDVNQTIDKLIEITSNINSGATQLKDGSLEIAEGNVNLSKRTQMQAANLEEIASSMQIMTSTVRKNALDAHNADNLATSARVQAEGASTVVNNAIKAMSGITHSSNKIADIITVIDDIAFQTNLLALNAAVEAARAGEQGRGFAVVASEVRNLAGRSSTAASEIKTLIDDTVLKIDEGAQLVDESSNSLSDIIKSVQSVSDIITNIAGASQEQAEGIEQVNTSISAMDEMTQQNAALVEKAATSSQDMGNLAKDLSDMIGFFTHKESPSPIQIQQPAPEDNEWGQYPQKIASNGWK